MDRRNFSGSRGFRRIVYIAMDLVIVFVSGKHQQLAKENRPAQIPQCTSSISHIVGELCTCMHMSLTKWCIMGYLADVLWDLWIVLSVLVSLRFTGTSREYRLEDYFHIRRDVLPYDPAKYQQRMTACLIKCTIWVAQMPARRQISERFDDSSPKSPAFDILRDRTLWHLIGHWNDPHRPNFVF